MKKNKREKENYLDRIPKINDKKWELDDEGYVEVTVENTGFYNTIAQKFFKKPRFSFINWISMEAVYGSRLMERKPFMKSGRF